MTPVFHTTVWEFLDSAHSSHLSHLLLWPLEIPQWKSAIFGWRHMDGTASFVIYQHFPYQCSLNRIKLNRKEPILDAGNHPDLVIIWFFTLVRVSVSWKISSFSSQRKKGSISSSLSLISQVWLCRLSASVTCPNSCQNHGNIDIIWLKTGFAHFYAAAISFK